VSSVLLDEAELLESMNASEIVVVGLMTDVDEIDLIFTIGEI